MYYVFSATSLHLLKHRIQLALTVLVFACAGLAEPVMAQQRVAFVTSVSGDSDLDSWPVDGLTGTGLDAADEICIKLAGEAGLDNAANFVAWMSDSIDDAYCRIHQLEGKKSSNCGQVNLPASAGPWVRTDGKPFAPSVEFVADNDRVVYHPLSVDQDGNAIAVDLFTAAWTGTDFEGAFRSPSCDDWNGTPAGSGRMGAPAATRHSWTDFGTQGCAGTAYLYCLETEAGSALELPEPEFRIAFMTDASGNGDLSSWPQAEMGTEGLSAGDSICRSAADAAGLPAASEFKAWLSDGAMTAKDRFVHDGPIYRLDGFEVGSSLADLADGQLTTPINQREDGSYVGNFGVWTGTAANGTAAAHCASWQSTASTGTVGTANFTSARWTTQDDSGGPKDCSQTFPHLYCIADINPATILIFKDGFEDLQLQRQNQVPE
jgi:hypothetical protein